MPLLFKKKLGKSSLAVWDISESVDELLLFLNERSLDLAPLSKFNNENRKKEWLACRVALAELVQDKELIITYDNNSKPHLKNYNISFSHSKNIASAYISEKSNISIDVEKFSEKVVRVKHKFLNKTELSFIGQLNEIEKLVLIWSAKETLFKYYSKGELDFSKNLHIEEFNLEKQGELIGQISKDDIHMTFKIFYEIHQDFALTYLNDSNIP